MVDDSAEFSQRWTTKRCVTLVLSILKGESLAQAAARKHGLRWPRWRSALLGAENALRARPKDEEPEWRTDQEAQAEGRGALVLDLDLLKEASADRSFRTKTSDE